jgi:hypothetical protein
MATVIPQSEIASTLTTLIVRKYDEVNKARPTSWFRSHYKETATNVRYPSIDVRRGSEKVAVDVIRGHQGVRTQLTKGTQKIFDPFYFNLYFDATEFDSYWRLFGSTSASVNIMTEAANDISTQQLANRDMIDRAIEKFCAEVFEFGTCTSLRDGSIVDFNRKAGSFPDAGAGQYWADSGVIPYDQIQEDCEWIRWNGKYTGSVFHMTLGSKAYQDFMNNAAVLARNDIKHMKLDDIVKPTSRIEGQTYHGTISCGPYIVHIFQYPQFYEHPTTGAKTPYMNDDKYVLTPAETDYDLLFGAIPTLVRPGASTLSLRKAKYVASDRMNLDEKTHKWFIESSPLPVPTAIDTMVTRRVKAAA